MTDNILQIGPEIWAVVGGTVILFIFALAMGMSHRPKTLPGSSGHRSSDESSSDEEIRADGYIDSFAGEIEEAGGSMPPVVKLALPVILIWWLLYLIFNWTPK